MLACVTLLLVCQLVGEVIAQGLGLPLPGPVIGMVLLFLGLLLRGGVPAELEITAKDFLDHLSLLFVPAGVGVVLHLTLVRDEWLPISAGLVASTVLTIMVTALVMVGLSRLMGTQATGEALKTGSVAAEAERQRTVEERER